MAKDEKIEKMKVLVEILTGRLFHVEIEEGATVGDLKREIAASDESLPEHRLVLVLGNGPLMKSDAQPLTDYGVTHGSHIYLFFVPLLPSSSFDF
ncbi:hypothetical protein ACLOJK_012812 [Asimina triloba]